MSSHHLFSPLYLQMNFLGSGIQIGGSFFPFVGLDAPPLNVGYRFVWNEIVKFISPSIEV